MKKEVIQVDSYSSISYFEIAPMLFDFSMMMKKYGKNFLLDELEKKKNMLQIMEQTQNDKKLEEPEKLLKLENIRKHLESPTLIENNNRYYGLEVNSDIEDFGFYKVEGENKDCIAISLLKFETKEDYFKNHVSRHCLFTYNTEEKKIQNVYYFYYEDMELSKAKVYVLN